MGWGLCLGTPGCNISHGDQAFESLLAHARAGDVFGLPNARRQIVEALPPVPGEQHLALCQVSDKKLGPPRNCVTVAILTKSAVWLRGHKDTHQFDFGCLPNGAFSRITGTIWIRYRVQTNTGPLVFASAVHDLLLARQSLSSDLDFYKNADGSIYSVWLTVSVAYLIHSIA